MLDVLIAADFAAWPVPESAERLLVPASWRTWRQEKALAAEQFGEER